MRLFVAIEIPDALRRRLAERLDGLRPGLPPARWARLATLHLTLVFLGETPGAALPALDAALGPAFRATPRFDLAPGGGGTFPPGRPARVAWVGFEPSPLLAELQRTVAAAAVAATGGEVERRPFHPHLTLARCRPPWPAAAAERWRRGFEDVALEPFAVARGVLFESRLEPGGVVHGERAAYPLGAA